MLTLESVVAGLARVEHQGARATFILNLAHLINIGANDRGRA